jgi:hypothetical protein
LPPEGNLADSALRGRITMLAAQASRRTRAVDGQDDKRAFEVGSNGSQPVGPGASSFDSTVLDFGHHAGRSIAELAATDPDYLRWLARHPSGFRYRGEIERVLELAVPHAGDRAR